MNNAQFGKKWDRLAELKRQVQRLEQELAGKILEDGKTILFAGMKDRISRPSKKYDYEDAFLAWANRQEDRVKVHRLQVKYTRVFYGAEICNDAGIPKDDIPFSIADKPPVVVYELIEEE
jgi:hypothetical protein